MHAFLLFVLRWCERWRTGTSWRGRRWGDHLVVSFEAETAVVADFVLGAAGRLLSLRTALFFPLHFVVVVFFSWRLPFALSLVRLEWLLRHAFRSAGGYTRYFSLKALPFRRLQART